MDFTDDYTIPEETKFYYSKRKLIFGFIGSIICLGGYLLIMLKAKNGSTLEYVFLAVFCYLSLMNIKNIKRISPVITINSIGIEVENTFLLWSAIANETADYDEGSFIKFDIIENGRKVRTKTIPTDQLTINNDKEINYLLKVYRSRYEESVLSLKTE